MNKLYFVSSILLIASINASADTCEDYPNTDGTTIEYVNPNNFKILSTYSTSVNFDDTAAIRDAREEAQIQAKAQIIAFTEETIKSETSISKTVDESISMQGASKVASRNQAKQTLQKFSQNAQGLLRGVVLLGDCYTPSKEVRVTVGIKPETITQAGNLAGSVSGSHNAKTHSYLQPQPLSGSEGFSNTKKLKDF